MAATKTKRKSTARKQVPANPASLKDSPSLRLEWRTTAELADNPANWRTHPKEQLAALRDVIDDVGWAGVVLFNQRTNRLIDGHARKEIAKPDERLPVLVGDWSEEQERTILATLDPLAAMATTNKEKLAELMKGVQASTDNVKTMLEGLAQKNGVGFGLPEAGDGGDEFDCTPDASGPTRAQSGDLWLIRGNGLEHRLLVGDCTDKANVDRLMSGELLGLCFTSPPYAQQRDYGEQAKEKVQDWYALMCGAFTNLPMAAAGQVLVNLGLIHRDGEWVPYWDQWIEWMRAQGWRRFGWYVWDQGFGLPGDWNGRLAPSHEFVWHFNRDAVEPEKWVDKKPENIKPRNQGESTMRDKDGKTRSFTNPGASGQPTKIPDSIIRVGRQVGSDGHPAQFPIGLPTFIINTWPTDVYDPFLGSGTTLIAAHRLGRRCFGCEIEPRYADVILRRCEAEGLTVEKSE